MTGVRGFVNWAFWMVVVHAAAYGVAFLLVVTLA